MLGILILFLTALALIIVAGTYFLLHGFTHPARKTHGNAVALGLPADPSEINRTGQAVTFTFPDGTESDGLVVQGDQPQGPCALLTHGYGDARFGALQWSTLVLPHVSHAVVYDVRAHGNQSAKTFHGGGKETDDLIAIAEQLQERKLLEHGLVLMGYSMGANLSVFAAADQRMKSLPLSGLVLEGPYRYWAEPIRGVFRLRRYPEEPIISLAQLWLTLRMPAFMRRYDLAARAQDIQAPTLILHGTHDPLCPVDSARKIAQALPNPQLEVFAEGRHLDLASVDEQRYLGHLADFFHTLALRGKAHA